MNNPKTDSDGRGAQEDEDEDFWWYVCTLCFRAFKSDTECRAHKRLVHGSKDAANVLILSQTADLEPRVNVTRCNTAAAGAGAGRSTPTAPDQNGSPKRKKRRTEVPIPIQSPQECKLCSSSFFTQTELRNHVLVVHVPAPMINYHTLPAKCNQPHQPVLVHSVDPAPVPQVLIKEELSFTDLGPESECPSDQEVWTPAPDSFSCKLEPHEEEFQFQCSVCFETFAEEEDLLTHTWVAAHPRPLLDVKYNVSTICSSAGGGYAEDKPTNTVSPTESRLRPRHSRPPPPAENGADSDSDSENESEPIDDDFEIESSEATSEESDSEEELPSRLGSRPCDPRQNSEIFYECQRCPCKYKRHQTLDTHMGIIHKIWNSPYEVVGASGVESKIAGQASASLKDIDRCGFCLEYVKGLDSINNHVIIVHLDHIRNSESGRACHCLLCYQNTFLTAAMASASTNSNNSCFQCKICGCPIQEQEAQNHVRKLHPGQEPPVPLPFSILKKGPPSEWRGAKLNRIVAARKGANARKYKKKLENLDRRPHPGGHGRLPERVAPLTQNRWFLASFLFHTIQIHKWRLAASRTAGTFLTCYSCGICGTSHLHLAQLTAHIRAAHDAITCRCPLCKVSFNRLQDLERHTQEVHAPGFKSWTCVSCMQLFKGEEEMRTHSELKHAGASGTGSPDSGLETAAAPYICPECYRVFPNATPFRMHFSAAHGRHRRNHALRKSCTCATCFKDAFLRPSMSSVNSATLQTFPWDCKLCGEPMHETWIRKHVGREHPGAVPQASTAEAPSEWRAAKLAMFKTRPRASIWRKVAIAGKDFTKRKQPNTESAEAEISRKLRPRAPKSAPPAAASDLVQENEDASKWEQHSEESSVGDSECEDKGVPYPF